MMTTATPTWSVEVPAEPGRVDVDADAFTTDAAAGTTTSPLPTLTLSTASEVSTVTSTSTATVVVTDEPTSTIREQKGVSLETLTIKISPTPSCSPTCTGEISMSFVSESTISGSDKGVVVVLTVPTSPLDLSTTTTKASSTQTGLGENTRFATSGILPEITVPAYTPTTFRLELPWPTLVESTEPDGSVAKVATTLELGVTESTVYSGPDTTVVDEVGYTVSEEPAMNTMGLVERTSSRTSPVGDISTHEVMTSTRTTKALVVSKSSEKSSSTAVDTTTPEVTSTTSTTAALVETTSSDGRNILIPTASGVFRTNAESLASSQQIVNGTLWPFCFGAVAALLSMW